MTITKKPELSEGSRRDWMTDEERKWRGKLIKLLQDDGKGHHHAAYAKRLAKYDLNIVPIGKKPATAAISFDEGVIYINRGFLTDDTTFGQLNVLMRHELCHNLLMHQFRMVTKLSKDVPELNLKTSQSIHEMLNAIEDFDISNQKYSAEDKETVKNFWLNGKIISGLVTEDHRSNWVNYSLEKMYDSISKEIEKFGNTGQVDKTPAGYESNLNVYAADMHKFKQHIDDKATYYTIDDLYNSYIAPARKYNKNAKLADNYEAIFKAVKDEFVDNKKVKYSFKDIESMWKDIGKAKAVGKHDVVSPVTGEVLFKVYTPEEKELAMELLKTAAGYNSYDEDYKAWYDEIIRAIKDNKNLTPAQIKELSDIVNS